MRFEIVSNFSGIGADAFVELFFDESYNQAMASHIEIDRIISRHEEREGKIIQEGRTIPHRQLPGFLKKLVGGVQLEYQELSEFDLARRRSKWSTTPNVMPQKVSVQGEIIIEDNGSGGVQRIVKGEMLVRFLGVGTAIEKAVVGNIKDSYTRIDRFTQDWIDSRL